MREIRVFQFREEAVQTFKFLGNFRLVVRIGGHAHHAADGHMGQFPPRFGVEHLAAFLERKSVFAVFFGDMDFQQAGNHAVAFGGLFVDFGQQLVGVYRMNHGDVGRNVLHLVGLQVADEMPLDVGGQGSLLLAGLVDYLCAQQKLRGAGFTVAVPAGQEQAALLENKGFQRAFALRCLPREVSRNLWSQAEFDSVTARKLCELRERFYPDTVQFPPEQMAVVLTDLYARGATIVSSEKGYGIYFRREDTLYFVELMAEDDRSAEVLMEAAREKEVIVERAVITVGAAQNLFLGEGTRQDYGMIRFDAEPFDVEESYMRLMMES